MKENVSGKFSRVIHLLTHSLISRNLYGAGFLHSTVLGVGATSMMSTPTGPCPLGALGTGGSCAAVMSVLIITAMLG